MPSISELRKKIKGIKSTRQITSAMKMVAAARFARAQRDMVDASVFSREFEPVVSRFLKTVELNASIGNYVLASRRVEDPSRRIGLIVITGDKGLCGDFNTALLREADKLVKRNSGKIFSVCSIGKKACEWARKSDKPERLDFPGIFSGLNFAIADKIVDEILRVYSEKELTELWVVSATFKSVIKREVAALQLLPLAISEASSGTSTREIDVEPAESGEILKTLVPQWLKGQLYKMIRHSYAAELSARMNAMDNATRNAGEFIETQTLEMNKVRQAVITREIAEITGTSEVMQE